ncbi:hypothetical protein VTH82DRAFT_1964 [Thermothelomyces myriococcoides]
MAVVIVVAIYLLVSQLFPSYSASLRAVRASRAKTPLLSVDFPDPCIVQDEHTGTWYAFATGGWWTPTTTTTTTMTVKSNSSRNRSIGSADGTTAAVYRNIQAASAPHPEGPWTYLASADPLPSAGAWALSGPEAQVWAPSVARLNGSAYVLYYAALLAPGYAAGRRGNGAGTDGNNHNNNNASSSSSSSSSPRVHCIGAATSTTASPLGPYRPQPEPLICPTADGGAIDPAAFTDPATGRRYVVYKVDGNALGHGGECNNGVSPSRRTPLMLQEIEEEKGVIRPVGPAVEMLDRDADVDGPLVEAPDLLYWDGDGGSGKYVLFYSNHCWDGPGYSVNYAVAEGNITGPYTRMAGGNDNSGSGSGTALIGTGDPFSVTAPGGAATVPGGDWLLFHANCPQGRCLFGAEMEVVDGRITIIK